MLVAEIILASLLLAGTSGAEGRCLRVDGEMGRSSTFPVRIGQEARLSFRHSIYGSEVEELFRVGRNGLELFRMRYSEARLVEFYGHGSARFEQGWWVVDKAGPVIRSLDLRGGPQSPLRLSFASRSIPAVETAIPGGLVRLTVLECKKAVDD